MNTDSHRSKRIPPEVSSCQSHLVTLSPRHLVVLALSALLLLPSALEAFPPSPHHTLYGMVRDERGNPISADNAEVIFRTASGRYLKTSIISGLAPGQNYQLLVPMDAGLSSDLYQPTAMRPTMPFTIQVRIGNGLFLPIEVSASGRNMGKAGERTLLNLTLGEDSDGDGIPDAWERSLINRGLGDSLEAIKPGDDADGDGLTNLQEYLAGSYAFDNENGFALAIKRVNGNAPVLEFLAINGRSYRVYGSANLGEWHAVDFRLPDDETDDPLRESYQATDVRTLEVEVPPATDGTQFRFFKPMVQ